MKATRTSSAKITRPTLSDPLQRERLFTLLDAMAGKPVTWVAAPGGSGKSTLVASYIDSQELPCIWYQCDAGDSDIATFFYYMGLAAKSAVPCYKKPLPLLTPEYIAGIPTFTRRYFEILYSRLIAVSTTGDKVGFTIVLDNYQDVPANFPFHDMIATGFDALLDGVHIMVISRNEPPAAFARLRANGQIALLGHSDIRFTLDESGELVHARIPNLDNVCIKAMHEKTEGWAAGIILMLEAGSLGGMINESTADIFSDRVFYYFAGEIFDRTGGSAHDYNFLLKSAFLPILNVTQVDKLTGADNAKRILLSMHRQHLFLSCSRL